MTKIHKTNKKSIDCNKWYKCAVTKSFFLFLSLSLFLFIFDYTKSAHSIDETIRLQLAFAVVASTDTSLVAVAYCIVDMNASAVAFPAESVRIEHTRPVVVSAYYYTARIRLSSSHSDCHSFAHSTALPLLLAQTF